MSDFRKRKREESRDDLAERIISINRVAKVVKGGRNFSFNALVTVGDRNGKIGIGLGKARELADAIRKGHEIAEANMVKVPIHNESIPFKVIGRFGASKVLLQPASEGTGVIAGGPVRAVMDSAGIKNILAKSYGSRNPHNVVKATMNGLMSLTSIRDYARRRGITVNQVLHGVGGGVEES